MGDPKRTKKHYETPRKPHDKKRLDAEKLVVKKYGLKAKRELWKFETILRKKRENARKLLALPLEERLKREQELLQSLAKIGMLSGEVTLDDVLTLSTENLLERRLQTIVLRKGLANTVDQARQFVVHGHIAVNGGKVDAPSYLVTVEDEDKVSYYGTPMEVKAKQVKIKEAKKAFDELAEEGGAAEETTKPKEAIVEEKAAKKPTKEKTKEKAKEAPKEEVKVEEKKEEASAAEKKEEKPVEEGKKEGEE